MTYPLHWKNDPVVCQIMVLPLFHILWQDEFGMTFFMKIEELMGH